MTDDADEALLGGWMLARLFQAAPGRLDELREEKLGDLTEASVAELAIARQVLVGVHATLRDGDEASWTRLRRAAEALGAIAADPTASGAAAPAAAPESLPGKPVVSLEPVAALAATAPLRPGFEPHRALPFDVTPASAPERGLGLAVYAELCAVRTKAPEELGEALARYGITDREALHAFDRSWRKRFSADHALESEFNRVYREALSRRGSR